jgi:septum formation protein
MSAPTDQRPRIILASASPRRRELLAQAGIEFDVIPSPAEEIHDPTMAPGALCEENARLKATAIAQHHPGAWVIGADTLVFLDNHPLGKPADLAEAAAMLTTLSGRAHDVRTGVCVIDPAGRADTFHETTRVSFRQLDADAIAAYHALVNPLDKAGAYGIQEHGERIIESIDGPFDNVMGLPMRPLVSRITPP